MRRLHRGRECGWLAARPGTTKAPPCMRWRGLAGPAALRSPIARRPPALPDVLRVQRSAIARLTRSRNGLLVAVCRSRSLGSSSYAERVLLAVRRSRSLGSSSYARAVCPADLPRSLGTRQRGTAPPRRASIAQDMLVARPSSDVRPGDCSPVHTSEPITVVGNPLRTAVSRCSPRPGSRPPGRSPFPVTRRFLVGAQPCPTRAFRQHFPRVSASTGQSTAGGRLSPGNPALSTASSTGASTATSTCPASGHRVSRHSDARSQDSRDGAVRSGRRGRGSGGSRGRSRCRGRPGSRRSARTGRSPGRGSRPRPPASAAACAASAAARPGASGGSRDGCGSVRARGASGSATGSA